MLTFELNPERDELFIHADHDGLIQLKKQLSFLESGTHVHLMTPAWGGTELSEDAQGRNTKTLNKVTIYNWSKS